LSNVTLGPGPSAGHDVRFSFSSIRSRLRAVGVDLSTVEFSGPATVVATSQLDRVATTSSIRQASYTESSGPSDADLRLATQLVEDAIAVSLAILYAGMRMTSGGYDPGTFMSFLTALLMAADPARRLSQLRVNLRTALMAVEMVNQLLNDKEFEISGNRTNAFKASPRLESPIVSKDRIKEIILGGGQKYLSPERRFDAILFFSNELFLD